MYSFYCLNSSLVNISRSYEGTWCLWCPITLLTHSIWELLTFGWYPDYYLGVIYYPFPIQISGSIAFLCYFISNNFISTWKIYFWSLFLLSDLIMYICLSEIGCNRCASLIATLLYMYAPYHLVESIIEGHGLLTLGYAFFPLTILSFELLIRQVNLKHIFFASISLVFLILSHPQVFPNSGHAIFRSIFSDKILLLSAFHLSFSLKGAPLSYLQCVMHF